MQRLPYAVAHHRKLLSESISSLLAFEECKKALIEMAITTLAITIEIRHQDFDVAQIYLKFPLKMIMN